MHRNENGGKHRSIAHTRHNSFCPTWRLRIKRKQNIIINIVRAHEAGDLEYMEEVIAKGNMTKATEGDATADILTYPPTG